MRTPPPTREAKNIRTHQPSYDFHQTPLQFSPIESSVFPPSGPLSAPAQAPSNLLWDSHSDAAYDHSIGNSDPVHIEYSQMPISPLHYKSHSFSQARPPHPNASFVDPAMLSGNQPPGKKLVISDVPPLVKSNAPQYPYQLQTEMYAREQRQRRPSPQPGRSPARSRVTLKVDKNGRAYTAVERASQNNSPSIHTVSTEKNNAEAAIAHIKNLRTSFQPRNETPNHGGVDSASFGRPGFYSQEEFGQTTNCICGSNKPEGMMVLWYVHLSYLALLEG
ncbi:MAG: hypothetical protein Q9162_005255 [Coniocarpon cinnabarinum]